MKTYKTSGLVYGQDWGFNYSAYPAQEGFYYNYKELEKDIAEGIESGNLDSGMGYQSLKGAVIIVETIRDIIYKDRRYTNSSFKRVYFGDLNHKEKCFLASCEY